MQIGDELLLAPLGLFNTEVFALTGQEKRGQGQANAPGDPEDPHDANYLRETSVRFCLLCCQVTNRELYYY